jgi:hypothetical protein
MMLAVIVGCVGLFGTGVAEAPTPVPATCRLDLREGQGFQITIDNTSTVAVDKVVSAHLMLMPEWATLKRNPFAYAYTAQLDLSGETATTAQGKTRLQLSASSPRTWTGRLTDLFWSQWTVRHGTFRETVRAGEYRFDVHVSSEDLSMTCSSQGLRVQVRADGSVGVAEDAERQERER